MVFDDEGKVITGSDTEVELCLFVAAVVQVENPLLSAITSVVNRFHIPHENILMPQG